MPLAVFTITLVLLHSAQFFYTEFFHDRANNAVSK